MIKKRFISMLVLLMAVVTGAWADQLASSYSSNATLNAVTVSASMEVTIATGVTVTINNGLNITSGTLTVKGPGTLVVNGKAGSNGGRGETGGNGTPGSAAITGNIKVMDNATIQANGGAGGNGGFGDPEMGGNGANGAAAISGNVTVLGGATVKATGGNGGNGGNSDMEIGGNGGNGGVAFAGTLTYKGGTVTATGGAGGSGGSGDIGDGSSGSAGNAFATSVNFVSSDYILTDGSNAITATQVTSKNKVVISPKVAVNSVTLSPTSATLTLGETETVTLIPTVLPDDATDKTVTWTTSNASVATVANGVVTAVAPGTATITATATNGTADTSDDFSATCEVTVADPATKYDLTKADGSEAHGTVAFTVGGNAATQAEKDDVVTVSVTPNEGYSAKDVTVRGYTSWEAASEILAGGGDNPSLVSDINVTKQENGTWQFTMPEANVWVVVTYTKNLQDAWIQAIADQTYTGEAIEPTIEVKDGATTLVLNTDYTVAYSNNVNTGSATVTVTGTGNYSGTATANFTIVADKSALNTAIGEAETYYNSIKDDHAEAAAALKTAIDNAKAMQEKGDATQEEVNNALSALTTAKTTAEDAVLTETKTALNNDITAAETYYNSIKDSNPAAAATLLDAINAAKTVKDNADATQEQVDTAIAALASAKTTAEQTVLTETKTALNDDITDAEAYYNSI
ncbi:MAG: Ig-like domain-containing protein, partial [Prevotella sp.]|nr:Ig-like domain-containing protein [Prevotella sp.]